MRPMNVNVVSVPHDSQGVRPDLLGEALSKVPAARRKVLNGRGRKERDGGGCRRGTE